MCFSAIFEYPFGKWGCTISRKEVESLLSGVAQHFKKCLACMEQNLQQTCNISQINDVIASYKLLLRYKILSKQFGFDSTLILRTMATTQSSLDRIHGLFMELAFFSHFAQVFIFFFLFLPSHFSRDFKTFLQMTSHKKIVQFNVELTF